MSTLTEQLSVELSALDQWHVELWTPTGRADPSTWAYTHSTVGVLARTAILRAARGAITARLTEKLGPDHWPTETGGIDMLDVLRHDRLAAAVEEIIFGTRS